jgi:hypothetical protein
MKPEAVLIRALAKDLALKTLTSYTSAEDFEDAASAASQGYGIFGGARRGARAGASGTDRENPKRRSKVRE